MEYIIHNGRHKMLYTLINLALLVYSLILSCLLIAFNYYSLSMNATNHTGAPMDLVTGVYLATFAVSAIIIVIGRKKLFHDRKLTYYLFIALAIISFIAFINIVAYEQLNIMMYYKDWIHKGMPNKPHLF